MRKIGTEEHFLTRDFVTYLHARKTDPRRARTDDPLTLALCDIGAGRIKDMDNAGIDMEVLTLTIPGVEGLEPEAGIEWAKKTNDELAKAVKTNPDRFVGMAAIPMQDISAATAEFERCITKLGFKGGQINSHVQGEYLDDKKFWPIFEKAQKLDVPIYIHPKNPPADWVKPMLAYPALNGAMWGFAAEVGLHSMRLICSGVFDEFPRLKIVIGHMGEALPYWLWRIDNHFSRTDMVKRLKKKPSQYFIDNFMLTTSGMFYQPALMCAYLGLGADNIMFAVDYPHEINIEGTKFIDAAPIGDVDKEKICFRNAEKLFKIK